MRFLNFIFILQLIGLAPALAKSPTEVLCDGAPCPATVLVPSGGSTGDLSVLSQASGVWECNRFQVTNVFAGKQFFIPVGTAEEMRSFMWAVTDSAYDAKQSQPDPTNPSKMCCGITNTNHLVTKPEYPSTVRNYRFEGFYPGQYAYDPNDGHSPHALVKQLPRAPSAWDVPNVSGCLAIHKGSGNTIVGHQPPGIIFGNSIPTAYVPNPTSSGPPHINDPLPQVIVPPNTSIGQANGNGCTTNNTCSGGGGDGDGGGNGGDGSDGGDGGDGGDGSDGGN